MCRRLRRTMWPWGVSVHAQRAEEYASSSNMRCTVSHAYTSFTCRRSVQVEVDECAQGTKEGGLSICRLQAAGKCLLSRLFNVY